MKRIIFIAFLVVIVSNMNAQATLKFYNIKLKSSEITGLNSFGNDNKDQSAYVEILQSNDKWILKDTTDYTDVIGAYTDNDKSYIPRPLFNISTFNKQYAILDEIDVEFYQTLGIDIFKTRFPKIYASELFKKFKTEFSETQNSSAKKQVLLKPEYEDFRRHIIDTRLVFTPSASFTLSKEQQTKYTLKLKAELKYEISKIDANVGAKVDAYIDKLVDNATQINGQFLKVGFNPNYTQYLNNYISSVNPLTLKRDFFITQLERFISSDYARLITQIGVLFFKSGYDKSVISSSKIASDLKGEFQITPDTANKISAEINATFERKTKINLNSDFTGAFIISFLTDKSLDQLNFNTSTEAKNLIKGLK